MIRAAASAVAPAWKTPSSRWSPRRRRRDASNPMIQPGTAVWFAQHESRLAWRDWLSMVTGGRPERLRKVAIGIAAFIIFMHLVAYWVVGRYADAVVDKQTLVAVTASMLLSWLLMISQAMESITR